MTYIFVEKKIEFLKALLQIGFSYHVHRAAATGRQIQTFMSNAGNLPTVALNSA